MQDSYSTGEKFCEKCGSTYLNFCVECERRALPEKIMVLLNQFGLTDEVAIGKLAGFILGEEPLFAAVKLLLGMKGMTAPQKVEATVEEKGSTDVSKLATVLAKLANRKGSD